MLRHSEKASIYYKWFDVAITFDDGKKFLQNDPNINSFFRRKRKPELISGRLIIGITVGKKSSVVITEDTDFQVQTPVIDNLSTDLTLGMKAEAIIQEKFKDKSIATPIKFENIRDSDSEIYWLFDGKFYKDTRGLAADEVKALLLTRDRMSQARINRAKTIANTPKTPIGLSRRGFIPEDVRLLVWERDGGMCAKCNSQTELQFDHIIPYSLGGSSSTENLQILCGPCNRAKSNSIA